jgi:hypothetical protein
LFRSREPASGKKRLCRRSVFLIQSLIVGDDFSAITAEFCRELNPKASGDIPWGTPAETRSAQRWIDDHGIPAVGKSRYASAKVDDLTLNCFLKGRYDNHAYSNQGGCYKDVQ